MISKWFDLRPLNATLERFKSSELGVHLRLKVADVGIFSDRSEAIVEAGWIAAPDDEKAFLNTSRISAMSEVKAALQAFWPDASFPLVDLSKLAVTVHTGGHKRGDIVDPEMVSVNLLELPEGAQKQIINRVKAAASQVGLNRHTLKPFDGQTFRVWREAYDKLGEAITGIVAYAIDEFHNGSFEIVAKLEEILKSSENEEKLYRSLESLPDQYQRSIKDRISLCLQDPTLNAVKKLNDHADDMSIKRAHGKWLTNYLVSTPSNWLDGDFTSEKVKFSTLPNQICGFPIRYETGLASSLKMQSAYRIAVALDAAERVFGGIRPRDSEKTRFSIQVTKNGLARTAAGSVRGRFDEDIKVVSLLYSPYSSSALIHEIGHFVDFLNMPPEHTDRDVISGKYSQILVETGIFEATEKQIKGLIEHGAKWAEKEYAYLMDPAEIFARTFEAAMVSEATSSGDYSLHTLGGALVPREIYAVSDPNLLKRFIGKVREWNAEADNNLKLSSVVKIDSVIEI